VRLLVENASSFNADLHIAHTLPDTIALATAAGIGVASTCTPAGSRRD
jgi:hypothetical protein